MIDISAKQATPRTAVARAVLKIGPDIVTRIREQQVPKGDPLPVARVAAIQSAKNTSQMIPFCHPLPIDFVGVDSELGTDTVTTTVTVRATYKTGVEMEALTAAAVAALTIYDMIKGFGQPMRLEIELLSKQGGKSDYRAVPSDSRRS